MTDPMTKPQNPPAPELDADTVLEWLRQHPGFLEKNPEAIDLLLPPRENRGKGVADFQHYMVQRLKADRDEVLESAREIVETSRINMNNQTRIYRAVLLLLEARNFEEFVHTITMDFPALLDIDIVSLVVETEDGVVPQIHLQGVRAAPKGTVMFLTDDRPIVLEAEISGMEEVYGGGAGLVKSQALVRLTIDEDSPPALLAFGARDPQLFAPGQGTELVAFLGHVIERCMRLWLRTLQ